MRIEILLRKSRQMNLEFCKLEIFESNQIIIFMFLFCTIVCSNILIMKLIITESWDVWKEVIIIINHLKNILMKSLPKP